MIFTIYLKRIASAIGLDEAVFYTLIYRGWQIIAGVGTVLFVSKFLSPMEQGFYYTFASILSLQIFFELGLTFVIMQFASHEKALLKWESDGTLAGDSKALSRLHSITKGGAAWYAISSFLVLTILTPAGIYFFSNNADSSLVHGWRFAWAWLVVVTAGNLVAGPFLAVFEGCGLIAEVARVRAVQDLFGYLGLWIGLASGWGISSAPLVGTARFFVSLLWVVIFKRRFLLKLWKEAPCKEFDWWKDVWPMQWKIALSWISGFLIFQLFNPIVFMFWGSVEAGRMGMSLSITGALNILAFSWMNTKAPIFGQMIALKRRRELDCLFFKTLVQAFSIALSIGLLLWAGVAFLWHVNSPWSVRVLSPLPFGMLIVSAIVNVIVFSEATYLRAHKEEPFLWNSIIGGILVSLSTYFLGRYYGPTAITIGYCLITIVFGLVWATYVFISKRREWGNSAIDSTMKVSPEVI